jgi:hypothetical protein
MAINWWGDYVFENERITICSSTPLKGSVLVGPFINDQAVVAWTEKIHDNHSLVKVQNLTTRGGIGPQGTSTGELTDLPAACFAGYDPASRTLHLQGLQGAEELRVYDPLGVCVYRMPAKEVQHLEIPGRGLRIWVLVKDGKVAERGKLVF